MLNIYNGLRKMDILKKYWKEILIVLLLGVVIFNVSTNKKDSNTVQSDSLQIKQALEGLKLYQKVLEEQKQKLSEQEQKVKDLEKLTETKVIVQEKVVQAKKQQYEKAKKVTYTSNTLDSLLRIYTSQ